jgi:uncharacterized membrane protein
MPAILFYLIYLSGMVVFVSGSAPSNWFGNLQYGAVFGLFCYAPFELTNMALLKHWEWAVAVPTWFGARYSQRFPHRSAACSLTGFWPKLS